MKKIILILIILLCCGCYDYKELNDLGVISGIAIYKEDDNYNVVYEVVNTKQEKEDKENKTYTIKGTGSNLSKAISNANNSMPHESYFEHLKVVIISKDVDLLDISDYILRSDRITTDFFLVLADNPEEILSLEDENNPINSISIYNLLKNINYTKVTNFFDYNISVLKDNKKDISLPTITIKDDKIQLLTLGIYKDTNYIKNLSDIENNTYNLLINNKDIIIYDNDNSINIYNNNIKFNIKKDKIIISGSLNANITNLTDNYDLRESSSFDEINNIFKDRITNNIEDLISNLRYYNSDILGINKMYYIKYPNEYNDDIFKNINIEYDIKVNVVKQGLTGGNVNDK